MTGDSGLQYRLLRGQTVHDAEFHVPFSNGEDVSRSEHKRRTTAQQLLDAFGLITPNEKDEALQREGAIVREQVSAEHGYIIQKDSFPRTSRA